MPTAFFVPAGRAGSRARARVARTAPTGAELDNPGLAPTSVPGPPGWIEAIRHLLATRGA